MTDFVKTLSAIKRKVGIHPTLPLSMDNPKYHMMNNRPSEINALYNPPSPSFQLSPTSSISGGLPVGNGATLGIPVNGVGLRINSSASSTAGSTGGVTTPNATLNSGPLQFPFVTQRSSEEEGSAHDYHNNLQRELQLL